MMGLIRAGYLTMNQICYKRNVKLISDYRNILLRHTFSKLSEDPEKLANVTKEKDLHQLIQL